MKITVCKGCGQVMQARDYKTGNPACATCIGISVESGIPFEVDMPNIVHCGMCKKEIHVMEKNVDHLAFLDTKYNTYYCGCRGWD